MCALRLMWGMRIGVIGNGYFMGVIDWPLMCGYVWAVLFVDMAAQWLKVGWSSGCLCIVCVV